MSPKLSEKDEDAAVEKALREAHEFAACAGEIGIRFDQGAKDKLAVVVIFAVEGLLNRLFTGDLIAQEFVNKGRTAFCKQQFGAEQSRGSAPPSLPLLFMQVNLKR